MKYGAQADQRMAHDPDQMFLRNLVAQETQRWAEYIERGTREALASVRMQMRRARAA